MKVVEFGSLFEFIRNGMNVKQDKSGDGIPITRIETIADATVDASRVGYAGLNEADCRGWLMEPGDILFSHINSVEHIGKCAVYRGYPSILVHGMNLLCLRCDQSKLLPEFAKYLIRGNSFRKRLANFINKAVNQASVSIGNLKPIPVSIPPLTEQIRIAAILDQADALRVKRREALVQLDSLTQSIFIEMFGGDKIEISIGRMLDDRVLLLHKDGNHGSMYPRADDFGTTGIPFLSAKCVTEDGLIDDELIERLRDEVANKLKIGWIQEGDVLLAHNASVGKVALYDGRFSKALIGTSLTAFRPNQNLLSSQFLVAALRSTAFQRQLQKNMGQTTRNQVPITAQRELKLPLPPIDTQQKFAQKLSVINKQRVLNQAALVELDCLFTSLQDSAFRGELV